MEGTELIRLLKQLNIALERYGREKLDHRDLSMAQHLMLEYLLSQQENRIYSTHLHEIMGISKAAISSTLKSLYKKGYITFLREEHDERKKRIILTDKAKEMAAMIEKEIQEGEKRLCQGISEERLENARECLQLMIENVKL